MSRPSCGHIPVFVLAGGQGTRIRSVLGENTPKLLAPLAGQPFLHHLLGWLTHFGFCEISFGLGHLAAPIVEALQNHADPQLRLRAVTEPTPMGTAGAIRYGLQSGVLDPHRSLLVMNGDSMVQTDLTRFVAAHQAKQAAATLLCVAMQDCSRFGRITCNGDQQIVRFSEKDTQDHRPGLINGGFYLFEPAMLEQIQRMPGPSLEHDVFMGSLPFPLYGYPCDAPFIDFGTPASFAQAHHFFAPSRSDDL
ncbi:Nucleotidyl transferase [Magnetococcus marinus MC-1]|uniref:Nucleotidyl transferase n=1 Tax=Magnetococcus marinus (strain ATCC BAA-1437 / JCM 17883 / MC-1) TaxID=156889 RepID=A0L590_MAGMM|nr:nucleotidyltransferase family protein [Magnetococcus marinus]ABK43133.1 Nucleotidyl transferase [Magnetococcus marinus MC-1]